MMMILKIILNQNIDLLIVVAYGKIFNWLLEYPKYGCLNVHFSLLPKWRGAAQKELSRMVIKVLE